MSAHSIPKKTTVIEIIDKKTPSADTSSDSTTPATKRQSHTKQLTKFITNHTYTDEELELLGVEHFQEKLYKAGYIYLIWTEDCRKSGEAVFKLGMGYGTNLDKRISVYPKGSAVLLTMTVADAELVEKELHAIFAEKFKRDHVHGKEFYAGCQYEMKREIINYLFNEHPEQLIVPYAEALATRIEPQMKVINNAYIMTYPLVGPATKSARNVALINDAREDCSNAIDVSAGNSVSSGTIVGSITIGNKKTEKKVSEKKSTEIVPVNTTPVSTPSVPVTTTVSTPPTTEKKQLSELTSELNNTINNKGRKNCVLYIFSNLRDAVKMNYIDATNSASTSANASKASDNTQPKHKLLLKCNINNETKYCVYVRYGTKVSAKYPEVFGCESTYYFPSMLESIKLAISNNNNAIYTLQEEQIDDNNKQQRNTKCNKISFALLPRYRFIADGKKLAELYNDLDILELDEDEHTTVISIINELNNSETITQLNKDIAAKAEKFDRIDKKMFIREQYLEKKRGENIVVETEEVVPVVSEEKNDDSKNVAVVNDSVEDVPECTAQELSPFNGFVVEEDEMAPELDIQFNAVSTTHNAISPVISELLVDINNPKTESKKSISLTQYISHIVEYVKSNDIATNSFSLMRKADTEKCKLLIDANIVVGKYAGQDCNYAKINSIDLIGISNENGVKINIPELNTFIQNNYGATESRYRLTPGQTRKYEENKSDNENVKYNIFVYNLKKKVFRRKDYFDISITPDGVKIPPFKQ